MGFNGPNVPVEVQFQIQLPDDFFAPDADTNATPFVNINIPVRVTSDFQTFEFVLDQVQAQYDANVPEANREFALHYADVNLINLDFNVQASDGNARATTTTSCSSTT